MINWKAIEEQVEQGYIRANKHPEFDLTIYNYTNKAQYDWHWTPETRLCRGLIVDSNRDIIARPFEKFFSLDQLTQMGVSLPNEPFEVFDKVDGSLGILYWYKNEPYIATRGSFDSEQAIFATNLLRRQYKDLIPELHRGITYLFEIVYPENRVVVNYNGLRDIFLLGGVETKTGKDISLSELDTLNFRTADPIEPVNKNNPLSVISLIESNKEGVVIRYKSGFRVKVKTEEYKRLHKLLTGVNARHIWELLRNGQTLDSLLDKVPDEYYNWVNETVSKLEVDRAMVMARCFIDFTDRPNTESRKELADYFRKCKYPAILFNLLDKKPSDKIIWKLVEPVNYPALKG